MVRFTLKQCTYFLAVVEHGGIAQAARSLNISQPAVSQALDKLEETYGFRLLHRHHARGTDLTPEGRSFAAYCQDLLENATSVEDKANAIAAQLAGTIRFGCFHTIAPFHLAQIVKSYRAQCPQVDIVASELMQDEIIAKLESDTLDVALTYDMGLDNTLLEWVEVSRLAPVVILASHHPLADRSSISLKELGDEPFVMFEGASSRDYFQSVLTEHGVDPPIAFRSSSMESVRCAVANDLGFSLSVMKPRHVATYDGGSVASLPIKEKSEPISLVLASKKQRTDSALIDNFVKFACHKSA
ncbi:MAG: LysR family transcriptional regulator [Alphaproteobacteria bacterium]|nr:LysR family transcriptional regulator [Alphaproteobacteria bacterium]